MIVVFLIVVIIVVVLGSFFIIKNFNVLDKTGMINKKIDHGNYLSISYSRSGNSNGNIDYISLDFEKKQLLTRYREYHNQEIEEKTYKVSDEDLVDIIKYLDDNNVLLLSTYENTDGLYPLDGPSSNLSIRCSDKTYNIDGYIDFPGKGNEVFLNLTKKMYSLKK